MSNLGFNKRLIKVSLIAILIGCGRLKTTFTPSFFADADLRRIKVNLDILQQYFVGLPEEAKFKRGGNKLIKLIKKMIKELKEKESLATSVQTASPIAAIAAPTRAGQKYQMDKKQKNGLAEWKQNPDPGNITTASGLKKKVEELVKKDFQVYDYGFHYETKFGENYLLVPHWNKLSLFSKTSITIDLGGTFIEKPIYTVLATADIGEFLQLEGIKGQEKYKGIPIKELRAYYSAMQQAAAK